MATAKDDFAKHASLKFDIKNPRFDREFKDEDDVLSYLIKNADVDELVTSVRSGGWIDFEPMIVEKQTLVVLEGNRRLAALRLLSDPAIRERLKYKIPGDGLVPNLPKEVRIRWVASREEARAFVAFNISMGPTNGTRWRKRDTQQSGLILERVSNGYRARLATPTIRY